MLQPMPEFINFAVPGGGTRHYELPISRQANRLAIFLLPISLISLFLLLEAPDMHTRIMHFSDKTIPICRQGQRIYEDAPCLILSNWVFYLMFVFIIVFGLLLIGTFHRLVSLARTKGPHLKIDRQSFWCDQLLEPIKFENIESLTKLYTAKLNSPYGLSFRLKVPVRLTSGPKWGWSLGQKSGFVWVSTGFDDVEGLMSAVVFLVEDYKVKSL